MAFLSDTGRKFLANQPDPSRSTFEQELQQAAEDGMDVMTQIAMRIRYELAKEYIDERLFNPEKEYRKREKRSLRNYLYALLESIKASKK